MDKVKQYQLTSPRLADDRLAGVGGLSGAGLVDGFHTEFVLRAFVQVRYGGLLVVVGADLKQYRKNIIRVDVEVEGQIPT